MVESSYGSQGHYATSQLLVSFVKVCSTLQYFCSNVPGRPAVTCTVDCRFAWDMSSSVVAVLGCAVFHAACILFDVLTFDTVDVCKLT